MRNATSTISKQSKGLTASQFEALSDAEKNRIYAQIDDGASTLAGRAKPLTAWQRKAWANAKKKIGRPRLGKNGTEIVSVSVEKGLLRRANAYAKANGMKRSEMVTLGLRAVMRNHL